MPSPSFCRAARSCLLAAAVRLSFHLPLGPDALQKRTDAGSSPGSWGASLPENACLRMLCRSRSARARLASTVASALLDDRQPPVHLRHDAMLLGQGREVNTTDSLEV